MAVAGALWDLESVLPKRAHSLVAHICSHLCEIGIDAKYEARIRSEERIGIRKILGFIDITESLGIIDILEGPIQWVNVRRGANLQVKFTYTYKDTYTYYLDYAIPDDRLGPNSPKVKIHSKLVQKYFIGRAIDQHWKGKDYGLGIITQLNADATLKDPLIHFFKQGPYYLFEIRTYPKYGCWILSHRTIANIPRELWDFYQRIAQHLLAEWKST